MFTIIPFARLRATCCAIALVAAAATAHALAADTTDPIEHARALEAAAEALETHEREWSRAAALYREAADLRPADDPARVRNLRRASQIRYHVGERSRAMRDAAEAGELARRQGDVSEAAHSFLDAAWIAADLGRVREARTFVDNAKLLAGSPLLDEPGRNGIEERMPASA